MPNPPLSATVSSNGTVEIKTLSDYFRINLSSFKGNPATWSIETSNKFYQALAVVAALAYLRKRVKKFLIERPWPCKV